MKKEKKPKPYVISLKHGLETFEAKGETAFDALTALKRPLKITTKTLITLTQGARTASRMLIPHQAKRLFYPLAQQYLAKQLDYLLK